MAKIKRSYPLQRNQYLIRGCRPAAGPTEFYNKCSIANLSSLFSPSRTFTRYVDFARLHPVRHVYKTRRIVTSAFFQCEVSFASLGVRGKYVDCGDAFLAVNFQINPVPVLYLYIEPYLRRSGVKAKKKMGRK